MSQKKERIETRMWLENLKEPKHKVATLTAEIDLLRLKLEHKGELLALHNYYIKRGSV